jgi:LPXTG-motif cell wall-anchored protein
VAQNTPPPSPAPAPVADPQPQTTEQLPQTASNIPAIALTGLSLLGVAFALRRRAVRV